MMKLFENPHQFSGVVLARLSVNFASIFWALIVLFKADALQDFRAYDTILFYLHEDVLAGVLLTISLVHIYRLTAHCKPIIWGIPGYAILTLFWMYVWWNIIIQPQPFWPAALSCVSIVVLLSLYAFIGNPKTQ